MLATWGANQGFSPSSLFSAGEQGTWYDPSDLTTLFQDAAGTTPVTAVEQPVGLMLDKSKGLVLGSEKIVNGDGTSLTGWSNGNNWWTVSGGRFFHAASSAYNELSQTFTTTQGVKISFDYEVVSGVAEFFYVKNDNSVGAISSLTGAKNFTATLPEGIKKVGFNRTSGSTTEFYIDNISVRELSGNHAYQSTSANRPTLSARYNQFVGTETLATQNVPTVATTYTLRFEGTGSITLSGTKTGTYSAGTHSLTGVTVGTLTATVTGTVSKADLRVANDGVGIPAYQRVNTATDYDTVGFPKYLRFNGSSSAMATNSIDFTATDKMTVWKGYRCLASLGVICELSSKYDVNQGSFMEYISYAGLKAGLQFLDSAVTNSLNTSYIRTSQFDGASTTASTKNIYRLNGVVQSPSYGGSAAGTSNFGNYSLYIGARAGTSFWFSGNLYSLIVRGAASTDSQITNTEKYVNTKTKAY